MWKSTLVFAYGNLCPQMHVRCKTLSSYLLNHSPQYAVITFFCVYKTHLFKYINQKVPHTMHTIS